MGKPKADEKHYEIIDIEGITVYCDKTIFSLNEEVEIGVASYLGIKYLKVSKCAV